MGFKTRINGKIYDIVTSSFKCSCKFITRHENNTYSVECLSLFEKRNGEFFSALDNPEIFNSNYYGFTPRTKEWADEFLNNARGHYWMYDRETKSYSWEIDDGRFDKKYDR